MTTQNQNLALIEQVMIRGDLSVLSQQQKVEYYSTVCTSLGLNPLTKPLEYVRLNGKEVLYATKGATEQLRNIHGVSIKIVDKAKIDDIYVVTAEAVGRDNRCDSATGAVSIAGLKGEQLANAMMKAETKAKRRVTLSICGLNMLDETEVETIASAQPKEIKTVTAAQVVTSNNVTIDTTKSEPKSEFEKFIEGDSSKIDFGRFRGKTFDEVGTKDLSDYARHLEITAIDTGSPLVGKAAEFVKNVESYIREKKLNNK